MSSPSKLPAFRVDRLVEALDDRFITQAELARELQIPERTVTRWRQGRSQPRRANVRRLAALLGREPLWFYGDGDAPTHKQNGEPPTARRS